MGTKRISIFLAGEAICTDGLFITQSEVFIAGVGLSGVVSSTEAEFRGRTAEKG
jgi:hypothetical protein